MSRIFDALQRSEGERTGNSPAALPEGPELLREAERRVASTWETAIAVKEPENKGLSELAGISAPESVVSTISDVVETPAVNAFTNEERAKILDRFPSIPISLPRECRLACLVDEDSPTAEAVRLLAVRLRDLRRSRTLKKVVITSTIPREGKSTIAANLACALARKRGEKLLLIEGDVRLPALLQMFGIEPRVGLCELLRENRSLLDGVCRIADTDLWILPAGSTPGNPLEVLQSEKLRYFMDQLAACFDWIIIDSPPVLPLADTSVWMRLADGVLLVTRQGVTEKKSLQKGLEALEPQKVLGALLNGSKAARYSDYYYGRSR